MKKLNLICASIAVLCSMSASAGSLSGVTTFAQEIFGAATDATTSVKPGVITYTVGTTTGIAVNNGGKLYYTVTLGNGAKFDDTKVAGGDLGGTMVALITGTVNGTVKFSADKATAVFEITAGADKIIGVGSTITYTAQAGAIIGVKGALGTAGGSVSVTAGLSAVAANYSSPTDQTTPADLDGPAATLAALKSVDAATSKVTAATGTNKIDLAATPTASVYNDGTTQNNAVKFGEISFAVPTTAPKAADGTTAVNFAALWNTGASIAVEVTPNTAFVEGGKVYVKKGTSCGADDTAADVASAVLDATTAAAKVTLNIPFASMALADTDKISVCMGVSGSNPKKAIKEVTPVIGASLTPATALTSYDKIVAAGANGYALTFNGASVDVLTYWPGALDAYSYKGYLRITNTGTLKANVSLAHVGKDDGVVGTAKVIIADLQPGQSKLISTKDIDAVVGAAPSNLESGRAKVTAPTNGLRVQSLLQTGNDAPIEYRANNGN